jgi:hypothetical protein
MKPLRILSNYTDSFEHTECFLEHLKSLELQTLKPKQNMCDAILEALDQECHVAIMDPRLRFIIEPHKLLNLSCDVAVCTKNGRSSMKMPVLDNSFLLLRNTPKTRAFIDNWAKSGIQTSLEDAIIKNIYSLQVFPISSLLIKELKEDTECFLRWFLRT